jgi:TadE-like protein
MSMRNTSRQRGATLVEFVIVFPMAVLFVLTLIQVGFFYMAKSTLNHATFMAARVGALHNANKDTIREAMIRGLSPFYQDHSVSDDTLRLGKGYAWAQFDAKKPWVLDVTIMNPSADSFSDFELQDAKSGKFYIPNDNIEWRDAGIVGKKSKQNIRDANLLKLRVTYGYEMKVPLIAGVVKQMMCGPLGLSADCLKYYKNDRIPIETFAIVEMQSRAERP